MVKWTRSTLASDFSRLRHIRSPGCGLPETSRTLSLSRTPSMLTTARSPSVASSSATGAIFELDHIDAGVVDRRFHLDPLPDFDVARADRLAVAAHGQLDRLAVIRAVEDARGDDLVLSDDAVTGRLDQFDPALALALVAGDQGMQRRVESERGGGPGMSWTSPSVIMIAPPTRSGGASASASRKAAKSRVPSVSDSSREVSTTRRSTSPSALRRASTWSRALSVWRRPAADRLALRAVDDHRDNILERAAVLLHEARIAQSEKGEAEGERTEPGAARPPPDERDGDHDRRRCQRIEIQTGNQRSEIDRPGRHRVSLSMMSLA